MEKTGELLFILSSADRVNLLTVLAEKRLRLTQLAPRLSLTVQESSRQLSRLQNARLVQRESQGLFSLTSLGRVVLKLLPTFDFLGQRADYLAVHDLSKLPPEFIERLGELANHEFGETLGVVLDHFGEVLKEAREYVWLMADHILLRESIVEQMLNSNRVALRILVPRAVARKEDYAQLLNGFSVGKTELRLADEIGAGMALNEVLAGVTFPDLAGKLDFGYGFRSRNRMFHHWCEDLFSVRWNKAKRVA